jgi:hypothetical protein
MCYLATRDGTFLYLSLQLPDLVLLVLEELLRLDISVSGGGTTARHLQPLLVRQHPDELSSELLDLVFLKNKIKEITL